ncbi:unnamed protein product [Lactuca virosa]|uniref:Uncharacterized protein n=1 Tax=Lactuca virosa TaxID=75947 RepID=A0AAU9M7D0_9ASTR|nr:unnamed protein product [Lactuca virosa]
MRDVVIVDIPKMQTVMFVTSNPKNFLIVGSISQAMLSRVPTDHPIIVEYLKTTVSTGDKSKKKKRHNLTQVVLQEESSEHIESLARKEKESVLNNEEDFANIGMKSTFALELNQTPLVSSHMESEAEIYKQVVDDPFLNLSQTPPTPPIFSATSESTPIPTSIFFALVFSVFNKTI